MLKGLPSEGGKGRETLNNFIKRARSGQLPLEELLGSICAFEEVIYCKEKLSPAWGGLLSNLFTQVEANWRGDAFNTDIRSVQLVLLKRILKEDDIEFKIANGNLVIWTAALKEIRMLSGQAKEMALNWVLKRCKREAEEADWPVIFHNLICISQNGNGLLVKVFEGIYECSSKVLLDHLIFLIGQNGNLGKSWIKWLTAKGCFGIDPLMFSGLLILSQDIEYFHTLNSFTFSMIKLMKEIREITKKSIDPEEFLTSVASLIGSDSETGIKGSLELIQSLKIDLPELSEKFFLELYKRHPFARRELLKSITSGSKNLWKSVYEIDSIIFKEQMSFDKLRDSELIAKIIENEDQLLHYDYDYEDVLKVLIEIDSIVLKKALKNYNKSVALSVKQPQTYEITDNWDDCSYGQILVLRSQVKNEEMTAKFVELSELLLVPGGIRNENLKESLIELAIEFLIEADGIFSKKEKILMISKLISTTTTSVSDCCFGGSYEKVIGLFDDWSSYEGTLKYLLERISEASEKFYETAKQIPLLSVEIQNLFAKAVGRIEVVELRESVVGVIGNLAGRVVSEPQMAKSLSILLSKKYRNSNGQVSGLPHLLHKFTEISDPNLIKLIFEWGLEYGRIEGLREEMIKSILMFYGIIELEGEDADAIIKDFKSSGAGVSTAGISSVTTGSATSANNLSTSITSKFKNVHLNEKSVNFALTILLNELQNNLNVAHKLIKNYIKLYEEEPEEFMSRWVFNMIPVLIGLTRGLISGKGAMKLHSLLSSFYNLCQKLLMISSKPLKLRELTRIVGGQLNKQVYALIPLQQEKIQTILKQEMNLKKSVKGPGNIGSTNSSGKSVTDLIFEMEKFEETLISVLRSRPAGEKGWCEKIVRSTARDFKIKLEQL